MKKDTTRKYFLIYKEVFTTKPRQIISILFAVQKKKFKMHISNITKSKFVIKKISLE